MAPVVVISALALSARARAAAIVLDDFTNGVNFTRYNTDPDPMPNNSWICVDTDFNTIAEDAMLDGSNALKMSDSPGGSNGLYAIFPSVVPETGNYFVRCKVKFHEIGTDAPFNSFMIACTVNGPHRVGSNTISTTQRDLSKVVPAGVLTSENDSAKPSLYLESTLVEATQGADIRVMLSTASNYTGSSGSNWQQSYILVDEVVLFKEGDTVPVSLSGWTLE